MRVAGGVPHEVKPLHMRSAFPVPCSACKYAEERFAEVLLWDEMHCASRTRTLLPVAHGVPSCHDEAVLGDFTKIEILDICHID